MPAAVFCQLSSIHSTHSIYSIVSVIVNAYIVKDERGFKTKHEGFLPSPNDDAYVLKVKQDFIAQYIVLSNTL